MDEATLSNVMSRPERHLARFLPALGRFAFALLVVLLAWLLRLALDPVLGGVQAFPTFYVAVAVTAWWAGWRPAVFVLALGYLAGNWFFLPPRHSFGIEGWKHVVELFTYFSVAGTSILCITSLRKAGEHLSNDARVLEQEKRELEIQVCKRREAEAVLARHREELEQVVRERTAKLVETLSDLEHFSYSITHDMRAPLRAMQAYASLLEEESANALQPSSLEFLRRIKAASKRMDTLIIDSLSYAKVLRDELRVQPIDLGPLLRGIIETYPNLQPSGADIQLEFDHLKVMGNEAAFTQVFSNLLGNAVKFVAPGVKPVIRVRAESLMPLPPGALARETPVDHATPGTHQDASLTWSVRIWVEDNGIGIPEEAHQKIFGMFQRMQRESEYPGTGIGLAIVRKALERMGGRVGFKSTLGHGSRFWVDLAQPNAPHRPVPLG